MAPNNIPDEDDLELEDENALNLTLKGSVGSFRVGTGQVGQQSVDVKYFLTHVSLDFSSSANDALLSELAPVREVFDVDQLGFDELMQRDIDDARVSGELIPYLLDARSRDLVKLFPPIIVLVLPISENGRRPADFYPAVETFTKTRDGKDYQILRSGKPGEEAFAFEQRLRNGTPIDHDMARFKLNTYKTKLVIIDGQHRAMALLALYRNHKDEWSDEKRSPFKEYYAEWTPEYLQNFGVDQVQLPVMFCTFPTISSGYGGDMKLRSAARTVFLTLNKNARTVSNSRNILLNDSDLIAVFLRRTLSEIKDGTHEFGAKAQSLDEFLKIHSVELDQFHDRMKLSSPIALTGVNHLHYIVEHSLLNKPSDIDGAKARRGIYANRSNLTTTHALDRLNGRNLLGQDTADATTRELFTELAVKRLGGVYDDRFGKYVKNMFDRFFPFTVHSKASVELRADVEKLNDRRLIPILFDGQGIGRVFEAHRESLKSRIKVSEFVGDINAAKEVKKSLDATNERLSKQIEIFKKKRASKYLEKVKTPKGFDDGDSGVFDKFRGVVDDLYSNVFTTVAFQASLICGFYSAFERTGSTVNESWRSADTIEASFNEYIEQLNAYFKPASLTEFKRLAAILAGTVLEINGNDVVPVPSSYGFRPIVIKGEMQPDQWPKYRYLLFEVWNPSWDQLKKVVDKEVKESREQVFVSLYEQTKRQVAMDQEKPVENLNGTERNRAFNDAHQRMTKFLKAVVSDSNSMPQKAQMKAWIQESVSDLNDGSDE